MSESPAQHPVPSPPPADWVVPPTAGEVITSELTGNTYTMGEKIGEGYFGLVFSCVDVWGNSLAAKILKPFGDYEKVKASALAELDKLILLRHPHTLLMSTTPLNSAIRFTSSRSGVIAR
jgi:hypothetical protein